jgi:Protein of unknown function (DUF2752)
MMVRILRREGGTPLGAIFLGIGVAAAVVVGIFHLDRLPFSFCAFKAVTGLPCMTCGTTRTLGLLFAGQVKDALVMNPLATVVGAAIAFWGLADLFLLRQKAVLSLETDPRARPILKVAGVLVVIANWAYLIASGR